MSQTYSVPDMSCGHCRASIEKVLKPLGATLDFDAQNRRVTVSGGPDTATVVAELDKIGFDATPV